MAEVWAHPQFAACGRWRTVGTPGGDIQALLPPATLSGVSVGSPLQGAADLVAPLVLCERMEGPAMQTVSSNDCEWQYQGIAA